MKNENRVVKLKQKISTCSADLCKRVITFRKGYARIRQKVSSIYQDIGSVELREEARYQGKIIVFHIYECGQFEWMLDVAIKMSIRFDHQIIFWSPYYLPSTDEFKMKCQQNGIIYTHEATALGGLHNYVGDLLKSIPGCKITVCKTDSTIDKVFRSKVLLYYIVYKCIGLIRNRDFIHTCDKYYHLGKRVAQLYDNWGVKMLILPEDNTERDSNVWLVEAKKQNIPAYVLTSGLPSTQEAQIACFNRSDCIWQYRGKLLATLYMWKWLSWYQSRWITRLPVTTILGLKMNRYEMKRPWMSNSGKSTSVLVESEFIAKFYQRQGLSRRNIRVIGSANLDKITEKIRMYENEREELAKRHQFDSNKPIVLCALPPNQYPDKPAKEFTNYQDLILFWVDRLSLLDNYNILFSPHPNIDNETLSLLQHKSIRLDREGVVNHIALCDVYVASMSSTIKWARACGKYVINYDVYEYRYDMYDGDQRCIATCFCQDEFTAEIEKLQSAGPALISGAKVTGDYWGALDSRSIERVMALFSESLNPSSI